nr:MAG TPA: Head protein [Caudoviricetes sp.]
MPTKLQPTNENLLAAAREAVPYNYQDRIPDAVKDGVEAVFTTLQNNQNARNAMIPAIVDKIAAQSIDSADFKNPLAMVKKEPMRYGAKEEEIFINLIKGTPLDTQAGCEVNFKYYYDYAMAAYHTINFNIQYPFTVKFDSIRKAFFERFGIRDYIAGQFQAAYASSEWDEYLTMKELIDAGYKNKLLFAKNVDAITDEATAKAFLRAVRATIREFRFPKPNYNTAGANSSASPDQLVLLITPEAEAAIDVDALAYAFHMSRAEIETRTIVVDGFDNENIVGVLADIRFFKVRDQFKLLTYQQNAASLNWDYFLTVSEMISASPFYPVCVFTTEDVGGDTITFTTTTAKRGAETPIIVTLTSTTSYYAPQLFDYSLKGNVKPNTMIVPGTNILIVDKDETGTLTMTAKYRLDPNVTKDQEITLS